MGKTLFEKIWDSHLVDDLGDGFGLIFVDRQLLTELATPQFDQSRRRGMPLCTSRMYLRGVGSHGTDVVRQGAVPAHRANSWTRAMREKAANGIHRFRRRQRLQGISSVIAPEIGLVYAGHDIYGARQPFVHVRRARGDGMGLVCGGRGAYARDADQHPEKAVARSGFSWPVTPGMASPQGRHA